MYGLGLRFAVIASMVFGAPPAWPPAAAQSASKVFRVGHLAAPGRTPDGAPPRALREALREFGYVEGRNVVYESRFAEGKFERLPDLAAELVRLKVDVIVAQGGKSTEAARRATTTIPIVMAPASGDAVAVGWIATLARPGANITGLSDESIELSSKRMELLKEAVPNAALIAILWNEADYGMTLRYREIEKAARALRVEVQAIGMRGPEDFATAFATMSRRRPDAMFLIADALTNINRKQFVDFAAANGIPAMYESSLLVREGGLMSYGSNLDDEFREAARYIDRIFKGVKPADLPAVQPTRYSLVINRKTANALGLAIAPALLLRADQIVE
ncbi:MAG TPA: ABC transporter substrate-binding protein [Gemmatimonadaceae bacterium]|nr:ABC transporter substrate-binding protein [Gemmatimonadaceae bacterium]